MPESDRHDGSDKYLAPHHLVNRLAYYFSPEGLANGDTAVEEVRPVPKYCQIQQISSSSSGVKAVVEVRVQGYG